MSAECEFIAYRRSISPVARSGTAAVASGPVGVVSGATRRFYYAGDTGYSPDLAAIGERLGPIHLAAVPIGAYRPAEIMHLVQTTPEEAVQVGRNVRARRIVAMHFGTFDLATSRSMSHHGAFAERRNTMAGDRSARGF